MLKDARSEIKFQEESAEWERNGKEGEYAQYFGFGAENKETEMNWRWGLQREPIRHAMGGGGIYIYIYICVCGCLFLFLYKCLQYYLLSIHTIAHDVIYMYILFVFTFNTWVFIILCYSYNYHSKLFYYLINKLKK